MTAAQRAALDRFLDSQEQQERDSAEGVGAEDIGAGGYDSRMYAALRLAAEGYANVPINNA